VTATLDCTPHTFGAAGFVGPGGAGAGFVGPGGSGVGITGAGGGEGGRGCGGSGLVVTLMSTW
jgi:hypothetical protein